MSDLPKKGSPEFQKLADEIVASIFNEEPKSSGLFVRVDDEKQSHDKAEEDK
jgi:hypothetical protein